MSELQTVTPENTLSARIAASIASPLVLIADADPASRLVRTRHFEQRGYRVTVARTPFETIVKASCRLPDLIVVDGSLGDVGVSEATELLATCPATAHIPIVRL
jgi:CheY-like chemotaxis protein